MGVKGAEGKRVKGKDHRLSIFLFPLYPLPLLTFNTFPLFPFSYLLRVCDETFVNFLLSLDACLVTCVARRVRLKSLLA